jgi:hypothetical protein
VNQEARVQAGYYMSVHLHRTVVLAKIGKDFMPAELGTWQVRWHSQWNRS